MKRLGTDSRSPFTLCLGLLICVCALAFLCPQARAQTPYDTVAVAPIKIARAGITMNITAGASGAPGGFTVCWMTLEDFEANGSDWDIANSNDADMDASFTGTPTKHTAGGTITTYTLGPYETVSMEIGDLFDETGVQTTCTDELEPGTTYVMCAYANAYEGRPKSANSMTHERTTDVRDDCLYTQGYWKNHPVGWPRGTLTLGTVTYTKAQLLDILNTPAQGNGLIFLAHQLIATKLNLALGASGTVITDTVAASDALIDGLVVPTVGSGYLDPSSASELTNILDDYNNGELGSEPCEPTPAERSTWGHIKAMYR